MNKGTFSGKRVRIQMEIDHWIDVCVLGYRGKAKPNLVVQETNSIACAFRILFRLYSDPKHSDSHDVLKQRILKSVERNFDFEKP